MNGWMKGRHERMKCGEAKWSAPGRMWEQTENRPWEEKDERMKGEKIMGKIADISKHQGRVDWEQAAGELDMVILRNGIMLCW